jgi:hypothetical protein
MNVAELLAYCEAQGIRLETTDAGGLSIDSPAGALTPELTERLKAHKPAILAALWSRPGQPLFPPIVMEALRSADARLVVDPEPLELGPDGWPVDSVDPNDVRPCATCGGLDQWQNVAPGGWHCARCDPPYMRSCELLQRATTCREEIVALYGGRGTR